MQLLQLSLMLFPFGLYLYVCMRRPRNVVVDPKLDRRATALASLFAVATPITSMFVLLYGFPFFRVSKFVPSLDANGAASLDLLVLFIVPMACAIAAIFWARKISKPWRFRIFPIVVLISGYLVGAGALIFAFGSGLSWGRPLRIRGRNVQPELTQSDEWCEGNEPDVSGVDSATAKALEALWLHDAKKEYASIPAFARLTWQMISLGAPPDLIRDLHIAGLQEVDHTKKCFALAAGFGGRKQSVLPMLEILHAFDNIVGDPYAHLAAESLSDGCLLEGFNADTAEGSARICEDAVSRRVIQQIAREERFHAELSWRVLEFCFEKNPRIVAEKLKSEAKKLLLIPRPTATSIQNLPLVEKANPDLLVKYGRLPERDFEALWRFRLDETLVRLKVLLSGGRTSALGAKVYSAKLPDINSAHLNG